MKAPNSKHQAPVKLQAPNTRADAVRLEFDVWSFSGAWMLGLGVFR
jgi:hypothetical protein